MILWLLLRPNVASAKNGNFRGFYIEMVRFILKSELLLLHNDNIGVE